MSPFNPQISPKVIFGETKSFVPFRKWILHPCKTMPAPEFAVPNPDRHVIEFDINSIYYFIIQVFKVCKVFRGYAVVRHPVLRHPSSPTKLLLLSGLEAWL